MRKVWYWFLVPWVHSYKFVGKNLKKRCRKQTVSRTVKRKANCFSNAKKKKNKLIPPHKKDLLLDTLAPPRKNVCFSRIENNKKKG